MIIRQKYLDQLLAFRDRDLVKVVTGVRRCGKSTLLDMMREHLAREGVSRERLLTFKMESMEFDGLDYRGLYQLVRKRTEGIVHPYLFFDELQEIEGWERAINSLHVDLDCDMYITGSNAYLLSSELATLLSGRYVEVEMLPLVFSEFLDFQGASLSSRTAAGMDVFELPDGSLSTAVGLFDHYRRYGGLPYLSLGTLDGAVHKAYCRSLYETVVIRDILERDRRRGRRQLTSPDLLERTCRFLADNIGNENSVNSIAGALRADGIKAANSTVDAYMGALDEAYLFYPVRRYDIRGKDLLKTGGKRYIVDTGIRNYLQDYRDFDQGRVFENMVYLQLRYEGFEVSVGKLRSGEVDFVASRSDGRAYIQVTEDMTDSATMERELKPLRAIRDAYPKFVIAARGSYPREIDGIRILDVMDFFLQRRPLLA